MKFEECQEKGLIFKTKISEKMILESFKKAKVFLDDSKFNLKHERFSASVILGYNSFFALNQTLLFNKGYNEKSHACLSVAVRELYKDNIEIQDVLKSADQLRLMRHKVQYSGYDADIQISDFVVSLVSDYLEIVKELLKL